MEKLLDVLAELKDQRIAIKEKGEIQWSGKAQDFNPYYYTTRHVVKRTKVPGEKTKSGLVIQHEKTILELD